MHKPVTFADITSINIKKEMDLLQCAISFPMMHKGKLIGLFNINSKVTEEPVYKDEIEIIYVLCNYLAAAVKDIDLYHEIWYQKEFTGNLLSSMNSGMIAIDSNEKITVFNQKASEILNLDSSETVGSDLRELPSPLGDILYETMVTGKLYQRHEAAVNPSKICLGINSYRLLDDQKKPVGAGIIFSDLSYSRKIEEQKRMADKLKAVNDLVAKIAHEVRNPLTSIQTYTQLLNEKFKDDELKNFYVSAVSQSIGQLNNLIDKLVTFSGSKDYNFITEDINDVLRQAEEFIFKNIPGTHKFLKQLTEKSLYINADRKYFIKAIYYLVLSIVDRTVEGTYITMSTSEITDKVPSVLITITFSGETALEKGREKLLKPFLDVDHLGSELNVPISHKIIEGHGGRLDMKSEGIINTFKISLPTINRVDEPASIKGKYISE
jgi:nitrogen fixation/metabolism regulation signal transduction histidine kinase